MKKDHEFLDRLSAAVGWILLYAGIIGVFAAIICVVVGVVIFIVNKNSGSEKYAFGAALAVDSCYSLIGCLVSMALGNSILKIGLLEDEVESLKSKIAGIEKQDYQDYLKKENILVTKAQETLTDDSYKAGWSFFAFKVGDKVQVISDGRFGVVDGLDIKLNIIFVCFQGKTKGKYQASELRKKALYLNIGALFILGKSHFELLFFLVWFFMLIFLVFSIKKSEVDSLL